MKTEKTQLFNIIWNLRFSEQTGRLRFQSEGPLPRREAENVARGLELAGCAPIIVPIESTELGEEPR